MVGRLASQVPVSRKEDRAEHRHARPYFQIKIGCLVVLLFACLADAATAQDERATVRLEGRTVMRVGPIETANARVQAQSIEARIGTLLDRPDAIVPARIETQDGPPPGQVVQVAGVPVMTVTEADARDNLTSVDALARQWAQAIDAALERARERRLGFAAALVPRCSLQSKPRSPTDALLDTALGLSMAPFARSLSMASSNVG